MKAIGIHLKLLVVRHVHTDLLHQVLKSRVHWPVLVGPLAEALLVSLLEQLLELRNHPSRDRHTQPLKHHLSTGVKGRIALGCATLLLTLALLAAWARWTAAIAGGAGGFTLVRTRRVLVELVLVAEAHASLGGTLARCLLWRPWRWWR